MDNNNNKEGKVLKIIFLDTETSGLKPGNICQLSYAIVENKKVTGKNYFFTVPYIEPRAEAVHGFSVEILKELSGGKCFNDFRDDILADLDGAHIVGHNISFDMKFIDSELGECLGNERFCTMNHFTDIIQLPSLSNYHGGYKRPKLMELADFMGVTESEITEKTKEVFGISDELLAHDARYDVVATMISFYKGMRQGLIKNRSSFNK